MWNNYDRVISDLPRTNNSVEGWHRAFQQTIDCHHPSIYKIIQHFKTEQHQVQIKLDRYNSGFRQPEASKSKYVLINRRIKTLVQNYNRMDHINYLQGLSHNFEL